MRRARTGRQLDPGLALRAIVDAAGIAALIKQANAGDEELGRIIDDYLDMHESIATGVRHHLYDIDVIAMQLGGRVIALAQNYRP